MLRLLSYLLIITFSFSCSSEKGAIKRMSRIEAKHPNLFNTIKDTIYHTIVDSTGMKKDTLTKSTIVIIGPVLPYINLLDTIVINGPDRIVTRVIVKKGNINNFELSITLLPDLEPLLIKVPIERVKKEITTKVKVIKKVPIHMYILLIFLFTLCILLFVLLIKIV